MTDKQMLDRILARVGVDESYVARWGQPKQLPLDAAYLEASNPRLVELASRYSTISHAGAVHSRWSASYAKDDIPLSHFRGDSAFVWQRRDFNLPVTYLLTYYYLLDGERTQQVLPALTEDALFGVDYVIEEGEYLTRDRIDSALEITYIASMVGTPSKILDIGSGYGRLAHRMSQHWPDSRVSCVDAIPEATFLCEFYLTFRRQLARTTVVPLDELEPHMAGNDFDLAVNIHSFSECRLESVEWWLGILNRKGVRFLFVVPNARPTGQAELVSWEVDGRRLPLAASFKKFGYELIDMRPKYASALLQRFGVTPTSYWLFQSRDW